MKKTVFLIVIFTLLMPIIAPMGAANAQVPKIINYQALLKDGDGNVIDYQTTITFSFYDRITGGTSLWTESYDIKPEEGFINVYLGVKTPIDLAFDIEYYLEIKVGDGDPFPRTPLSTVPYSMYSMTAMNAEHATTADIAATVEDGSITSDKLADDIVATPSGKAGGDLAGEYPNPILKSGSVSTQTIQDKAITGAKINNKTIQANHLYAPSGNTNDVLKIVNASTGEVGWGTTTTGGAASGDLSGLYPNPTVSGLRGKEIAQIDPIDNQLYIYDATTQLWVPRYLGVKELNATFMDGTKPNTLAGHGSFLYYRYGGAGDTNKLTWSMVPGNDQIPVWNNATRTFYWIDKDISGTLDKAYEEGNIINVDAGTPVKIIGTADGNPDLQVDGETALNGNVAIGNNTSSYSLKINDKKVLHEATAFGGLGTSDVAGTYSDLQIKAAAVGPTETDLTADYGWSGSHTFTNAEVTSTLQANTLTLTNKLSANEMNIDGATLVSNSGVLEVGTINNNHIDLSANYDWSGSHTWTDANNLEYVFSSDVPANGNDAAVQIINNAGGLALFVNGDAKVGDKLSVGGSSLNDNALYVVNNSAASSSATITNAGAGNGLDVISGDGNAVNTVSTNGSAVNASNNSATQATIVATNTGAGNVIDASNSSAANAVMKLRNTSTGEVINSKGASSATAHYFANTGTTGRAIYGYNNSATQPTLELENADATGFGLEVTGNVDISKNLNANTLTLTNNLSADELMIDGLTIISNTGVLEVGTIDNANIDLMATYDWSGSHTWTDANNLEYVFYSNVPANANDAAVQIRNDVGLGLFVNGSAKVDDKITVGGGTLNDNAISASNNSGASPAGAFVNSGGKALHATSTGNYALHLNRTDGATTNDALMIDNGGITLTNGIITNISAHSGALGMLTLMNAGTGNGVDATTGDGSAVKATAVAGYAIDASNNSAAKATMKLRNTSTAYVLDAQGTSSGEAAYIANTGSGRGMKLINSSATLPAFDVENSNTTDGSCAIFVNNGSVVLSNTDASGVADLTNYGDKSVIEINQDITTAHSAQNGQIQYIYNSDASAHTFAGTSVAAGEVGQFVYADAAWQPVTSPASVDESADYAWTGNHTYSKKIEITNTTNDGTTAENGIKITSAGDTYSGLSVTNSGNGSAIGCSNSSTTDPTLFLRNDDVTDASVALQVVRGGVVLAYMDATGVADLSDYGDYTVLQINVNITTPPTGTNGQILYIYNSDVGDHTFDGGTIKAGSTATFISIGGTWRQVDDADD